MQRVLQIRIISSVFWEARACLPLEKEPARLRRGGIRGLLSCVNCLITTP